MSIKVGIVGASGYTASELLRLLITHPQAEISCITSRRYAGQPVSACMPQFADALPLFFSDSQDAQLEACSVVFFATPSGIAMQQAPKLLAAGVRIIDLSPDFRFRNIALWEQWYGIQHDAPQWAEHAVYGLPEIFRSRLSTSRLIANPGCYATVIALILYPLLHDGDVAEALDLQHIVADAKSGISGSGKQLSESALFSETAENFCAYASSGHRHHPEICDVLNRVTQQSWRMCFVPHKAPMIRGMLASVYIPLRNKKIDWRGLYASYYDHEPFIILRSPGVHPQTREVRGTNACHLAIQQQENHLVIFGAIDNLGKGAAGQAVQNMNCVSGINEICGLTTVGTVP